MQKYHFIFFKFMLMISAIALTIAFLAEYIYGMAPCKMCYYQRYVYVLILILSLLGIGVLKKFSKIILYLVFIMLVIGTVVSFTHFGMERGFINLDQSCSGGLPEVIADVDQFKDILLQKDYIRCDVANFTILNISMAGWNFVFSLVFIIISGLMLWNFSNHKESHEKE